MSDMLTSSAAIEALRTHPPGALVVPATRAYAQRRFALERWLDARSGARVRQIVGPPGAGKTTAIALWAQQRPQGPPMWVTLPARCSAEMLLSELVGSFFAQPAPNDREAPLDLVVDGIAHASPEACGVLARLPAFLPATVHLIYLLRSELEMQTVAGDTPASVELLPPALLPFDADEIRACTQARGVGASPAHYSELLRVTGGNAAEVVATIRFASAARVGLIEACSRLRRNERPPFEGGLFEGSRGQRPAFVPFPVPVAARSAYSMEPATVEMFGRFSMRVGAREVRFVRRRDRQIVQYLALRPGGTASRSELMDEFWPGTSRQAAARRFRTACSTIRRAIAACVGDEYLDAYFRALGGSVVLSPENVLNEVTYFEEHLASAERAGERGDVIAVRRHLAAALRLHDRPLLSGEAPAKWIAQRADAYEKHAAEARELLDALEEPDAFETTRSA